MRVAQMEAEEAREALKKANEERQRLEDMIKASALKADAECKKAQAEHE